MLPVCFSLWLWLTWVNIAHKLKSGSDEHGRRYQVLLLNHHAAFSQEQNRLSWVSVFPGVLGEKITECKKDTCISIVLETFCMPIRAKCFFNIPANMGPGEKSQSCIFPKIKISRDGKSLHRTTLLSRLRQAPGELIADIPHFKHLPYVHGKYSHVTYHFLFSFHWFMFCLE